MVTPMDTIALATVAITEPQSSYWIACSTCRRQFDALGAQWCTCLVTERTLVCPHCGQCFCKAPTSYKSRFWGGAPRALWDVKALEHHTEDDAFEEIEALSHRPLVLVVDDEAAIRRVAVVSLGGMGYGVALARNGIGGLEAARRLKPDLILTDALMPKLDGRDMCRQVKDDPGLAHIPVIVMTALYTSIKYRLEGHKRYHVDDYLAKPVSASELRRTVDKYLRPASQATGNSVQTKDTAWTQPCEGDNHAENPDHR